MSTTLTSFAEEQARHMAREDISALAAKQPSGCLRTRLQIVVSEPKRRTESLAVYIVYKVSSILDGAEVNTVYRRYTDFVWLQKALSQAVPGAVVPALPSKQAVGRFDDEFVEQRRVDLEIFINEVTSHPEGLCSTRVLGAFLQCDDASFGAFFKRGYIPVAVDPTDASRTRRTQALTESAFYSLTAHALTVEDREARCGLRVKSLAKAEQTLGDAMGELGIAFALLAEDTDVSTMTSPDAKSWLETAITSAQLGNRKQEFGAECAASAARAAQEVAALARAHGGRAELEHRIERRVQDDGSVRSALNRRAECVSSLQSAARTAAAAAKSLGKVRSQVINEEQRRPTVSMAAKMKNALGAHGPTLSERVAKAAEEFEAATSALDDSKLVLAQCDARLSREMGRFEARRGAATRGIIADFARSRIEHLDAEHRKWTDLLNTMQPVQPEEQEMPTPTRAAPKPAPTTPVPNYATIDEHSISV